MADSTSDIVQYASVAGELAKNLWGRTDFEKYDAAWAALRNWWVDFHGGIFTRPGSEFGDVIEWTPDDPIRFFTFQYSPDTSDTYLVIMTGTKIRFAQDNAYVLEAAKAVTAAANGAGNRITLTSAGHGFANGDLIKLSGFTQSTLLFLNTRTIKVANTAANTFDLADVITGSLITKASISTGTGSASRVYTVASPYSAADLNHVQADQISDVLRLTHRSYYPKNLTRTAATSWAIASETFGGTLPAAPTITTSSASGADGRYAVYLVAAVTANGEEGPPGIFIHTNCADIMGSDDKWNRIGWTAISGTSYYKIYRSVVQNSSQLQSDQTAGYIGRSVGTRFTDNGITPDFTDQPVNIGRPFDNGNLQYVNITTEGDTYTYTSVITWPAGGTGAYGWVVTRLDGTGGVNGIKIIDGGINYTSASMSVAHGAGTNAVLAGVAAPASGNYPGTSCLHQQRQVYGGTDNSPLGTWASRPGFLSNFNFSDAQVDDDSWELEVDSAEPVPIRHVLSSPGGLLCFNQVGVYLMYARESKALTADNAQCDTETKIGSNWAKPVVIENAVGYGTSAGQNVRLLTFDGYNNAYTSQEVSLLSNHLYADTNEILRMAYAPYPYKQLYVVQGNGTLLTTAIDTANGVFGTNPNYTQGFYKEVAVIEESSRSMAYVAVERYIQSTRCLFFERFKRRDWNALEDSFCVDAGLALAKTAPTGRLTPSSLTGAVTFTVTGGTPFAAGDVGKVLRCADGIATISHYTSSTQIEGTWTTALTATFPETTTPLQFATGSWWLDSKTTAISGLWQLIGQSVAILADGLPTTGTVDQYGALTLAVSSSRVAIGLGYTCRAQTLPPSVTNLVMEGRRKDIVGVNLLINETYGLKFTNDLTKTAVSIQDRPNRLWGTSPRFRSESLNEFIRSSFDRMQQIYFIQDTPQPATILSFVRDIDLGDDK